MRIIAVASILFCLLGFVPRKSSEPTSAKRADKQGDTIEVTHTVMKKKKNSVLWWLGKRAMEAMVSLAIGESVKYISDRAGLAELFGLADNHLEEIKRIKYIDRDDERAIDELRQMCSYLENELIHTNKSLNEIGNDFEQRFDNLDKKVLRLSNEIDDINRKLYEIEKEQNRQYRMIVDNRGRVRDLENAIVDMQGDVEKLRDDVDDLEKAVYKDVEYDIYLSGAGTYSSTTSVNNEGLIGMNVFIQNNLTSNLGVWGAYMFSPIKADVNAKLEDSSIRWDNHVGGGGITFMPFSQVSPVKLQVGVGGVLIQSNLMDYPVDAQSINSSEGEKISQGANIGVALKGTISIGPHNWNIVPVGTFTYLKLKDDIYTDRIDVSNAGNTLWSVGVGLRLRFTQKGFNDWVDE